MTIVVKKEFCKSLNRYNAHAIEIPFPQRDLHIKEWPVALERKL
jgi:small-conductance mechanosensitive channel